MYAMVSTRPDIAYAVVVSKFMSQPGRSHWAAVKSILFSKAPRGKTFVMARGT